MISPLLKAKKVIERLEKENTRLQELVDGCILTTKDDDKTIGELQATIHELAEAYHVALEYLDCGFVMPNEDIVKGKALAAKYLEGKE